MAPPRRVNQCANPGSAHLSDSWAVSLEGGWQQMFFLAEGHCEGSVTGRFRGANFPREEGAAGPFRPDFRAVIEADDGAVPIAD
jgi:hypothetical protein